MQDFALVNGTVVTHEKSFKANIVVHQGKIAEIREDEDIDVPKIDCTGKHILPGLIDAHVHFRTPGSEAKEDWETGSKAALAGGVTTVLDMPNNDPATVSLELLDKKRGMVAEKAMVNYGFFLGATPDNLDEIKKVQNVAGVKVFMGSSTGGLLVDKKEDLERLMAEAGKLLALHAENEECIKKGKAEHKGEDDPKVHSIMREECGLVAVEEALNLAKKYNSRVHICHLTSAAELETVRKFKDAHISVEVTPHHLFLTENDYEEFGNLIKVNPPMRGTADQLALWEGIKDGTIDMVASDHAPHPLEEKEQGVDKAPSGMPGVQTMLPLLLNAVNEGKLSLEKVVELTSFNPAAKFGIKGKGVLAEGADADITVVDLKLREKVCHHFSWSKANWSPFHGWELVGWPVQTFVNGNLLYSWRDIFVEHRGSEVEFE